MITVAKVYLLKDDDGRPVHQLGAVIEFQRIWRGLSKVQRAALTSNDRTIWQANTLSALRARHLIDDTGRLTLLGEAVVHYRPEETT